MSKNCKDMKRNTTSKDKCFNYYNMRHFRKNYIVPNLYLKKNKATEKTLSHQHLKRNYIYIVVIIGYDNLEPKLFRPSKINITKNIML